MFFYVKILCSLNIVLPHWCQENKKWGGVTSVCSCPSHQTFLLFCLVQTTFVACLALLFPYATLACYIHPPKSYLLHTTLGSSPLPIYHSSSLYSTLLLIITQNTFSNSSLPISISIWLLSDLHRLIVDKHARMLHHPFLPLRMLLCSSAYLAIL